MVKSARLRPAPARARGLLRLVADGDPGDTKTKILDAAFRRLAGDGYAALSMREIAKDAGVNHALINYHFRTKDQLLIAVLDEANRQLLARQQRMYAGPGGFAHKWAEARRFYRSDLASGFVRVQAELWAASMSNAELRANFVPRVRAWKEVIHAAVSGAFATMKNEGVALPPPLTASVVATWISEFWLGMEFADLISPDEEKTSHEAALDAMDALLVALDTLVATRPVPGRAATPTKRAARRRA